MVSCSYQESGKDDASSKTYTLTLQNKAESSVLKSLKFSVYSRCNIKLNRDLELGKRKG